MLSQPAPPAGEAAAGAVRVLEVLDGSECRRLLPTEVVGRLVHTEDALPAVSLLPFVASGGDVVVCAPVDVRLVSAPEEVSALDALGLATWVPGVPLCYLRIAVGLVHGRRVSLLTPPRRSSPAAPGVLGRPGGPPRAPGRARSRSWCG